MPQPKPVKRCGSRTLARADRSTAQLQHRTTLPAIVREGLIGLRHPMHVFPLLYRRPRIVRRIQQFSRELLPHTLPAAGTRIFRQPSERQRHSTGWTNFYRHLIRGAADPTGFHLNDRLHIINRCPKYFQRIVPGLLVNDIEGSVTNTLSRTLLPTRHQDIEKLPDELIPVSHIRERVAMVQKPSSRHVSLLSRREWLAIFLLGALRSVL